MGLLAWLGLYAPGTSNHNELKYRNNLLRFPLFGSIERNLFISNIYFSLIFAALCILPPGVAASPL
jgi:hypothetical protein